jgi:hypothetical protein
MRGFSPLSAAVEPRRFPPPWTVEETAPCFIVRDANEQALAFVYCEDEPGSTGDGPSCSQATKRGAGAAAVSVT